MNLSQKILRRAGPPTAPPHNCVHIKVTGDQPDLIKMLAEVLRDHEPRDSFPANREGESHE